MACTLLATASLGAAFAYVYAGASRQAETELRRGVSEASALLEENRTEVTANLMRVARLVADLPKIKAAIATADGPTVQPLADEYRDQTGADLLVLTGRAGEVLGTSGGYPLYALEALPARADVEERSVFAAHPRGIVQVFSAPIFIDGEPPDVLGRLTLGFILDSASATQLKRLTGSEIAFGIDGQIVAATLPETVQPQLTSLLHSSDIVSASLGEEDFIGVARPLRAPTPGGTSPVALVLRSRTERLRFLDTVRNGLIGALVATLLLATLVSYGVARTVTRPLSTITATMRDVAATGDLSRKIALRPGRWDDEDARVLATTYNTLTDSIARFQSESAQKDRLLSLGRLSTVIAHEIRNPLMIISMSLHSLRRAQTLDVEQNDAVNDIEGEVNRLNRIVSDVLDFAKPIQFQYAEADVNEICRDAAQAAYVDAADGGPALDLDRQLPKVPVDAERLRAALLNLLTNARHATEEAGQKSPVAVSTRRNGRYAVITVTDRGVGITPADMAHIFDPYFTTRRAGTGLGLPITRNIVEGMGGTIEVSSERGVGTEIRVQLPFERPA